MQRGHDRAEAVGDRLVGIEDPVAIGEGQHGVFRRDDTVDLVPPDRAALRLCDARGDLDCQRKLDIGRPFRSTFDYK